jgi:hypothetical protein
MALPGEAIPKMAIERHYQQDWMRKGRPRLGNHPSGGDRIEPWSAIFAAPGNRLGQARVELRNLELHVLSRRTGRWSRLFSGRQVAGWLFTTPAGGKVAPIDMRPGKGMLSIPVDARYMSHFWSRQLQTIDPDDVAGVYVVAQARMNPADYAAGARYVMDVAADYLSSKPNPRSDNGNDVGDAGIGRLKSLTAKWRRFYMTTAHPGDLARCAALAG